MNYPIIFKLLSVILSTLAIAFLICFGLGEFVYTEGQTPEATRGWLFSITFAVFSASLLMYLGRNASYKIFRKEALCVIGLGWIIASLVGAIPYILILPNCSLADAVFESTSGLSTTGSSVFGNLEQFPQSLMFWRCLSQWIGGLGVVVFFVAILSFLGAGGKILYSNESSGHSAEIESGRVQNGVLLIMVVYLSLSITCFFTYFFLGMSSYDALCHMFTTIATGGFSTYSKSIAAFDSVAIEWACILFMALGGTSFFVIIHLFQRQWQQVFKNTEVVVYYLLIFIVAAIITSILMLEMDEQSFHYAVRTSLFQVVSIITTSGYGTYDYELWLPVSQTLLIVLMLVGGCSGSTAGGTKVIRVVVAVKLALLQIEKAFRTRVVRPLHINGRSLDKSDQDNVTNYLMLLGLLSLSLLILISLFEHELSFAGAFGALLASLFNIGPGIAEVGPTDNFGFFNPITKYILSLAMIMGRLELYAVLVLFSPSLWKKFS